MVTNELLTLQPLLPYLCYFSECSLAFTYTTMFARLNCLHLIWQGQECHLTAECVNLYLALPGFVSELTWNSSKCSWEIHYSKLKNSLQTATTLFSNVVNRQKFHHLLLNNFLELYSRQRQNLVQQQSHSTSLHQLVSWLDPFL